MYIHFIRHGQTAYNKGSLHQSPDVPLSACGREQAERVALRLAHFEPKITKLITSDYARAQETAGIIADATGLLPEENLLFQEVRRPSSLHHKHYFGPTSLRASIPMLLNLHKKDWRHSDEENLFDIQDRIEQGVAYLKEIGKEHEHVAVVSHAFILNMFITYMCAAPPDRIVRVRDYVRTLVGTKKLHNASITTLIFNDDENPHTCDWMLTSFNDYDHLEGTCM